MKIHIAAAVLAATLVPAGALPAQTYAGWNSSDFWRDAPAEAWTRMSYLQQRISQGERDRSLSRAEARRAQRELNQIERQAYRLRRRDGGRLNAADSAWLQARLDSISRNLRWLRHNYVGKGDTGPARFATTYDARRYYRDGARYRERRLGGNDWVYHGSDGRYYCKRDDGTTGLVVGAAAGALLGNLVDGGHNRLAGTLIGGALGALTGKSIDQSTDVRCR